MIFYIVDTTVSPPRNLQFGSYPEAVNHLERMSERAYKQTRKQRMLMLEEIGHGYDDPNSVTFVRTMAEQFDMGVLREGRKTRCDISLIPLHQQDEFGS
jgi:hypothetical protein